MRNARIARLTASGVTVAAVALSVTPAVAGKPGGPEIVQKLVDDARRTVWNITRPVITRPEGSDYPQITFAPGDVITLSAGGCVRRGGNPLPNGPAVPYITGDADAINDVERARSGQAHLHNGIIHIPYLMPGAVLRPISQYLGTHSIPRAASVIPGAHLRLGYTDVENYGDNNYNDIDDIDAGPCKGKGYAFVRIEIAHEAAPAPSRREPRFNEVFRLATHNSYWVKRDNVVEAFASGVQQRLLDQLVFEGARSVEIDVHKDTPVLPLLGPPEPHNWTVYHTDKQSNSLCTPLRECLKHLRLFHHVLPQHEAVVVILELKEIVDYNFDDQHTPKHLDDILRQELGDLVYTPADFLRRCPAGSTMRACAKRAGWPTVSELRGKFLVAVIGNWSQAALGGHGVEGWAHYATRGGGVRDRLGFPMASRLPEQKLTIVDGGKNVHLGTDTMPRSQYEAALEASVFEQLEDLTPEGIRIGEQLLRDGIMIRSKDAFSLDDQRDRLAAGFQFAMTDYPWFKVDQLCAWGQRFVALRPDEFVDGGSSWLNEAGSRILVTPVQRPAAQDDGGGWVFAHASTEQARNDDEWETLPSTTRRSPDDHYPNQHRSAGEGCLRFASDRGNNAAQAFTFCRRTSQGDYHGAFGEDVILTAYVQDNGKRSTVEIIPGKNQDSEHRTTAGPGDYLRVSLARRGSETCVTAYSAASISAGNTPAWREHTRYCFSRPLPHRGIFAQHGAVLFAGTRRNGALVTATDLPGRDVSGDYRVDVKNGSCR